MRAIPLNRSFTLFLLIALMIASSLFHVSSVSYASTHTSTNMSAQYETVTSGGITRTGTTIWLQICGNGSNYRFRTEFQGTKLWDSWYGSVNGCTPKYRSVIWADINESYDIYSLVSDRQIDDATFFQRALHQRCTVTSRTTVDCVDQKQSFPQGFIDIPLQNQNVQGTIGVGGWLVDWAATTGTGIQFIDILANDTVVGRAYTVNRPDVAAFAGDTRFTPAGFHLDLDTTILPDGVTTLVARGWDTITGGFVTTPPVTVTIANGLPAGVTKIIPSSMVENAGDVAVTIYGSHFVQSAQVKIGNVTLTNVQVENGTIIHAVIPANSLSRGIYDLQVIQGSLSGTLLDGFTVNQPIERTTVRVMVYLACDDSAIDPYCFDLINRLESAMYYYPDLRIVAYWDRAGSAPSRYYLIQPDNDLRFLASYIDEQTSFVPREGGDETDSASPESLLNFLNWSQSQYPDKYTMLSLVGHGGGWAPDVHPSQPQRIIRPLSKPYGGMLWDMQSGDTMTTPEMKRALDYAAQAGKLDVLFLDACLMGSIEVASEFENTAQYMITNENLGWSVFEYEKYFKDINPSTTPISLVTTITQDYIDAVAVQKTPGQIGVVDTRNLANVRIALDIFAQSLLKNLETYRQTIEQAVWNTPHVDETSDGIINLDDDYIDLWRFAEQISLSNMPAETIYAAKTLMQALDSTIIINKRIAGRTVGFETTEYWSLDPLKGQSIYFPVRTTTDDWKRLYYNEVALPTFAETHWDEFIAAWFGNKLPPPPPTNKCDDCPYVPHRASLVINSQQEHIFPGDTVMVGVELHNIRTEDTLAGLQVTVQTSNALILAPTGSAQDQGFFPKKTLSSFVRDSSTWQAMYDIPRTVTTLISGTGDIVWFPFKAGITGCVDLTFKTHILTTRTTHLIGHRTFSDEICVGTGSIQGKLYLESRAPNHYAGATITLEDKKHKTYTTTTNAAGEYNLANLPAGKYSVLVTHPLFMQAVRTVSITKTGTLTMDEIGLWGGDLDQDRHIFKDDWYLCSAASMPVDDTTFDINDDGHTDVRDCTVVANNLQRKDMETTNPPKYWVYRNAERANIVSTTPNALDAITLKQLGNGRVGIQLQTTPLPALGIRITVPSGVTVSNIKPDAQWGYRILHWHQEGTTLYVLSGDWLANGNLASMLILETDGTTPALQIEAVSHVSELGSIDHYTVYIPLVSR